MSSHLSLRNSFSISSKLEQKIKYLENQMLEMPDGDPFVLKNNFYKTTLKDEFLFLKEIQQKELLLKTAIEILTARLENNSTKTLSL